MKYRKKPIVVEARQFRPGDPNGVAEWMGAVRVDPTAPPTGRLFIQTLEGTMRVDNFDWVIRGVKGEFYPCKPDIFAATYEPAE